MAVQRPRPTKAELAILRVLWKEGPLSVREVLNILNASRPTGYTSVLKTMQIMTEKGLVGDLIQRAYGGSVKTLVMHAIGTKNPSARDLEAIEKLLDRFERDRK